MPEGLHFLRPWWFLALLPLAAAVWALLRARRRAGAWSRVCDPALLAFLSDAPGGGAPSRWPALLVAAGGLLAVMALAGPAWERLPQPVYRGEAARVVVLSLAESMQGEDLRPTRLARARFKVLDLLARSREGRTGLVVFAGEPFVVSPLTDDADTIAAMVPVLEADMMPVPGRRLAPALALAGELLAQGGARRGQVLVIADGLDDAGAALAAARGLAERYPVSVIGVGTPEGVPLADDQGGFRRGAGGAVSLTRLQEDVLEDLAAAGGGDYRRLTATAADLEALLDEPGRAHLERREEIRRSADQWREAGPWLLIPLAAIAALAFRRGWLLVLVLALPLGPREVRAFDWGGLWQRPDQRAAAALEQGNAEQAARLFRDPAWRASALYRAGDYQDAAETFARLEGADAHYNRANALARAGDLEAALAAYERVLEQVPDHADARHNRELVERLLEQQQRPADGGDAGQDQEGGDGRPQQGGDPEGGQDGESGAQQNGDGDPSRGQGAEGGQQGGDGEADESEPRHDPAAKPAAAADRAQAGGGAEDAGPGRDDPPAARQAPQERPDGEAGEAAEPAEGTARSAASERAAAESDQAMEHWLRRIPDDPGGLLRRKFMLEHYRRRQAAGD